MPNYRYRGFDASGAEREGSVAAANAQEAAKLVASRGIRVRMVQEIRDAPGAPASQGSSSPSSQPGPTPKTASPSGSNGNVQRPSRSGAPKPSMPPQRPTASKPNPVSQPAPQPAGRVSPIQQRANPPAGPVQINVPKAAARKPVRTAEGTDKDRMFLFSQFASALRAGISPADFLQNVALRTRGLYKGSLEKMSEAAREGTPMSSVMELYPNLYPVHVIALTRAGEVGGFLPDAFETIAQQAEQAHKFKRWFVWIWMLVVMTLPSFPLVVVAGKAMLKTWTKTEETGGAGGKEEALRTFGDAALQTLKWPVGPISLAAVVGVYLFWRLYLSRLSRPLRHRIAISWPAFGPRARAENLAIFTWTMSQLTKAGLPHGTAWQLAAASAPNDAMASRLANVGQKMGGEQPLSSAMVMDRSLFPPEYSGVIGTAEFTGDVPGAMEQVSRLSRGEFESAQNVAKIRSGCWGLLGCAVSSAAVFGIFMYFYSQLLHLAGKVDNDTP